MGIPSCVRGQLAGMVYATILGNHLKPRIGSVTELTQSFLKFQDPSKCIGLHCSDGL